MKVLNKALSISPNHFKAIYTRGKTLYAMEKYEEASSDLDRATSLKPENISAHVLWGNILSDMGHEDEAALQWAIAERLKEKLKNK